MEDKHQRESWMLEFTDGSAKNAVRNGTAGVFIVSKCFTINY